MAQECCQLVLHSSPEQPCIHSALKNAAVHCCLMIAHLYVLQTLIGVLAVVQNCCQFDWPGSTKQQGMHFALNSAAVHWCLHPCMSSKPWQVYLQQNKPAVSLFCTAALSRGRLHLAKSSVALHWCWATAHLYKEQISIGVSAAKQACYQPVLHSSTEQGATAFCQEQCGTALVLGHCTPV